MALRRHGTPSMRSLDEINGVERDAAPAPAKCAMTRSPFFSMLIFRSQPGWSWSA